jgi:hypothetical protein
MCGLGPRVECAVLGSVDAVIALRVSQQVDQSQVLITEERLGQSDSRLFRKGHGPQQITVAFAAIRESGRT